MSSYNVIFQRNIGIYTHEEQRKLKNAKVAIIGAGGDGGLVAERLVRAGIGEIRICDPENFDLENLNRQFGSNFHSIGFNKAETVSKDLRHINPEATIVGWSEGISEHNIETFISGVNLVIDESEYSLPDLAIMINRSSRKINIPVLTGANVAFGANVFAFSSNGISVEEYYGMKDISLANARMRKTPISAFCPIVPSYVDRRTFEDVADGLKAVPAVSQSVAAVAAVVVNEAIEYLIGKRELIYLPKYISLDLHRRSMGVKRVSRIRFYLSLLELMIKGRLK